MTTPRHTRRLRGRLTHPSSPPRPKDWAELGVEAAHVMRASGYGLATFWGAVSRGDWDTAVAILDRMQAEPGWPYKEVAAGVSEP